MKSLCSRALSWELSLDTGTAVSLINLHNRLRRIRNSLCKIVGDETKRQVERPRRKELEDREVKRGSDATQGEMARKPPSVVEWPKGCCLRVCLK